MLNHRVTLDPALCAGCGSVLPPTKHRKPRKWCSNSCRVRAANKNTSGTPCACGCGQIPATNAQYLVGHSRRTAVGYKIDNVTGCWVWQGETSSNGYGRIKRNGRSIVAHRYHYERAKGTVPDGLELDHLCRNRACVNPDHLEPVTHAENIRRGRHTKLDWEKVCAIRLSTDSHVALAAEYDVTPTAIQYVRQGKSWVLS